MKNFFRTVLLSMIVTRIIVGSFAIFLPSHLTLSQRLITNPYPHYHIGTILIVIAWAITSRRRRFPLAAIGTGMILEEWPVLLYDMGFQTLSFYHTGLDFLLISSTVFCLYEVISLYPALTRAKI